MVLQMMNICICKPLAGTFQQPSGLRQLPQLQTLAQQARLISRNAVPSEADLGSRLLATDPAGLDADVSDVSGSR